MRSDPTLKRYFHRFNRRWFSGALPKNTVVRWSVEEEEESPKHRNDVAWTFPFREPPEIIVNRKYHGDWNLIKFTMLHEMVHIEEPEDTRTDHGKRWEARMLELATRGAFSARKNGGKALW